MIDLAARQAAGMTQMEWGMVIEGTGIPADRRRASKLVSLICCPAPWGTVPVDEDRKLDGHADSQDDAWTATVHCAAISQSAGS
ncbi:MAG: hypothetical protein GQ526_08040, partial [Ardenticatenales bacterium]|nr:hypothetical protein [Ardenticatenales bacterium]